MSASLPTPLQHFCNFQATLHHTFLMPNLANKKVSIICKFRAQLIPITYIIPL